MRLAIFTNKFPSQPTTFFARDMRALIDQGCELDIFPLYPLDPELWRCVPALLDERVLPRTRVHHLTFSRALVAAARLAPGSLAALAVEAGRLGVPAARYGPLPLAKSGYAAVLAAAWAAGTPLGRYDHVLAYWGNYAATAACLFHRLVGPELPFSMIVHARMDLYRMPAGLVRKMMYADNVFLVCEYNRAYLRQRFPGAFPRFADKLRIHHLGLDLQAVPFDPAPRPPRTVLAVGRFEPLKGFRELLLAARLLEREGAPVDVVLVGGGEQEGELRQLAERLGLSRRVTFRGWLDFDDVLAAMRQATLLAHPSISLDAMPTVLKEAAAVGTPVVASALAGAPEILDGGRCGVLVPPGDVPALARAIRRLVDDEALRRHYAVAAREHAERLFDISRNGRRLAERLRATRRGAPAA